MAFFNIRRNDNNKTPEELAQEIKDLKAKIKAYKDEISKSKTDRTDTIKNIKEKIEKENVDFNKAIEKLTNEKATLLKQTKTFEKKKTTKQEKIDKENTKANTDID